MLAGPRLRLASDSPRDVSRAMIVYGINPVLEALRADRVRELRVGARSGERIRALLDEAGRRHVRVTRVPDEVLQRQSRGGVHQGVVAEVEDVRQYSVAELVREAQEIPDRVRFLFEFDAAAAMSRGEVAAVLREPAAREVIAALAREIHGPILDREAFRGAANRVKAATGQKGKALFHPIRVALTGESGGPELDLAVPAIDRGATLAPQVGVAKIASSRERAEAFARAIAQDAEAETSSGKS